MSHGKLHRKLSAFGVLLLTLSCLSPVLSIYGVGPDVFQHAGTGAALGFLVGIFAALIWAVVYAELGSAYRYSGGDYVGVGSILGPWAGFASLTIWAVTAGPNTAFQVKIIATYVGEFAPALPAGAVTFAALGAATLVALLAVRTSAIVTGIFLAVEMLAVVALIVAGCWHPARSLGAVIAHPLALAPDGALVPAGIGAIAVGAVSAAFATCGGNQGISFGEELGDPHRRMGRVILIAGLVGAFATALPVIAVVLGTRDLPATLRSPAPFSSFFTSVAGPAAARALSAGVAVAIFNAVIAQLMFCARLFFSLGRDGIFHARVNRVLGSVHAQSGAPRAATLVVAAISGACCLLGAHVLLVFLSGLIAYSLALVCLAVLVGRRKGLTGQPGYWRSPLYPLAPLLGLGLAAVFAYAEYEDVEAGRPSIILLGAAVAAALTWHHFVLKRRAGGWAPQLIS